MIVPPNAIPYPKTVVVEALNTNLAFFTMFRSVIAGYFAFATDICFRFFLSQKTIFSLLVTLPLSQLLPQLDLP